MPFRSVSSVCFAMGVSSSLLVGCLGVRNQDVAVDHPAPPAAAYPQSSDSSGVETMASSDYTAPAPAPASSIAPASSAPAPQSFSLRPGEELVTHQIVSGDSLSAIASRYNTTVSRIQAANNMTGTKIIAGQSLQVPTASTASAASMASGLVQSAAPAPYPATAPAPPVSSMSAPPLPAAPQDSAYSSITAPPVPSAAPAPSSSMQIPHDPSSTSYPRVSAPQAASGGFPTPSFSGSDIQFSN